MSDNAVLLQRCRHFVLDMDGTFYLGNTILPNSLEFLRKTVETGRDYLFFTNNSSRSPEVYIQKLAAMQCHIGRSEIMTSGDVMIEWLSANHPGEPVYLVGTPSLVQSFREGGSTSSKKMRRSLLSDSIRPLRTQNWSRHVISFAEVHCSSPPTWMSIAPWRAVSFPMSARFAR